MAIYNENVAGLKRFFKVVLSGFAVIAAATVIDYAGGILNISINLKKFLSPEILLVLTAIVAGIEKWLKEKKK